MKYDAVVIGCGPAGMMASSLLSHEGRKVLIVDRSDRLGGRACWHEYRGCTLDYGMHLLITSDASAIGQVSDKLGIHVEWCQIPGLRVYTDSGWRDMMELAPMDDPDFARIAEEMMLTPEEELSKYDDLSIEDWIRERTRKDSIRDFLRGMAMVVTTLPDTNDMAASEVVFSTGRVLKTGKFAGVPAGGYKNLWDAFYRYLNSKGTDVRLDTTVSQIVIEDQEVRGIMVDKNHYGDFYMAKYNLAEQEFIEAPVVVYTGFIWDLFRIAAQDKFPEFFRKMVNGFKGNTTSAVGWAILAMREPATDSLCHHAVYKLKRTGLPLQFLPITNIDPSIAPDGRHLFIGGCPCELDTSDRTLMEEKTAAAKQDLAELFPGIWDSVEWAIKGTFTGIDGIARRPRCVGIFRPDVKAPFMEGLYFAGDTVRGRGVGMDFAARSGVRCAEKILGKKFGIE
ncbi:MAG TPA: FAD-dependent oxidoreductase [Deltaproteobacteria bacterium]|jgi:phytoene dehydrogenase-like protein|nr:FAD-dependent oxidoreductase [Deltaproteobacteria bacterium]HQI00280.1 FAD-dependent oxidoreductase [Deltaproteobacteria bacterium]